MVLPVGGEQQSLVLLTRTEKGIVRQEQLGVRFVPMTGEAEGEDSSKTE
jgi:protein-L-isoaspartate O-methyltransferase